MSKKQPGAGRRPLPQVDPAACPPGERDDHGDRPAKEEHPKVEKAFDAWLDRGLHDMFDRVAEEPVPEELLRLIDRDRDKKKPD